MEKQGMGKKTERVWAFVFAIDFKLKWTVDRFLPMVIKNTDNVDRMGMLSTINVIIRVACFTIE
jgi:hypothetical protein